ncbi:MAG: hypothetical protein ACPG47_06150, partial [Leucothrix sp.]
KHDQLAEKTKLDYLRREVDKGAIQAEHGEFSEHTVETLLEELNSQDKQRELVSTEFPKD